jgi:hypothetical protein
LLFRRSVEVPEFQRINYKIKAFEGLKTLSMTGELRKHVMDNDALTIENELEYYIPKPLNYSVVIFNQTTNITQMPSVTEKNKVISVSYLIAGYIDNYRPKDVRVYLWGFY